MLNLGEKKSWMTKEIHRETPGWTVRELTWEKGVHSRVYKSFFIIIIL
jgi:hypothetical protein